jgi:hypothetical protein
LCCSFESIYNFLYNFSIKLIDWVTKSFAQKYIKSVNGYWNGSKKVNSRVKVVKKVFSHWFILREIAKEKLYFKFGVHWINRSKIDVLDVILMICTVAILHLRYICGVCFGHFSYIRLTATHLSRCTITLFAQSKSWFLWVSLRIDSE